MRGSGPLTTPGSSLGVDRKWDVASIRWGQVQTLLNQGWEPFAVVQREPNTGGKSTEATVYLRRERASE